MFTPRRFISTVLSLAIFCACAAAQSATAQQTDQSQQAAKSSAPAVTASASAEGVRFTAPGEVLQTRLEVYAPAGERVFDTGARAGGIVDFKASDAPQGLADGSYMFVVTVKDLRGRATQRYAVASVQAGQISLLHASESTLTAAQTHALDASRTAQKAETAEKDARIAILHDGTERAVTVAAHDGRDGQVVSTTGALTFATGDLFAGRAREQMRVTPDGRVGIGTADPQATLDVAGTIRARGGIVFDDGTILRTAPQARTFALVGTQSASATTGVAAAQSGLDVDGNITITPSTGGDIHLSNTASGLRFYAAPELTTSPAGADIQFFGNDHSKFPGQAFIDSGANNSAAVIFRSAPTGGTVTERMRVASNGNVGVGTAAPAERLEVAGNLKVSGIGNGVIFPDGSKQTTAATGGGSMTGTQIVNAVNDAATAGAISDARISPNVARLNAQNAWTGQNTFVNGLSANGVAITNVGNPVSATDAANKAYVDGGFVKFAPGAEQLSVGDANGTAPMINLRGGSTCCSGPGGHTPAWFKVFQNGSFVATGNLGIGVSPMQGKGYRTSWDSYKGAFRSGYADAEWDDANVGFFSWAGGSNSTAIGLYALAFGDTNSAESTSSIVFGSGNQVKGAAGFAAGAGNRVCDTYGVALGNNAKSGGPLINGRCDPDSFNIHGLAAVAIGYNVTADQDHTLALGKFASNNGFTGTFVWSDGSATASADTFKNTANNEFAARATGGFRFRTNLAGTTGCNLPAGSGVFNCTSSRTTKENFLEVGGEDVLARLRRLSVSTWNYISEGRQTRHMGPMAEDFYAAFGLGTNNISIGVQDLAGVSLAAVKALDARTAKLQETNAQLGASLSQRNAEVAQLRSELNSLRATSDALARRLDSLERDAHRNASARRTTSRRGN